MSREQKLRMLSVILACCMASLPGFTEPKNPELPSADAKQRILDLENDAQA